MLLLPTPVWVLMTVATGLVLLVVEPSGSARTIGVSALAGMVLAGVTAGLLEARREPGEAPGLITGAAEERAATDSRPVTEAGPIAATAAAAAIAVPGVTDAVPAAPDGSEPPEQSTELAS